MTIKSFKIILGVLLISLPWTTFAEIITIEDVEVEVQPLRDDAFKLFFKFDLPPLPDKANIDYAVLSFGVNIVQAETDQSTIRLLEILAAESTPEVTTTDYNTNPTTVIIPRDKVGSTQVDLDITQMVDLWVSGDVKNEGISLVSHRKVLENTLRTDKIVLAPELLKPTLKVFYYTVID